MKLVIAGSRHINPSRDDITKWSLEACESFNWEPATVTIISGGARGVDRAAEDWAHWLGIPFELFEADWNTHGRKAGPIRNQMMALAGDALLLIWDGKSKGSTNMKKCAAGMHLPVYEVIMHWCENPGYNAVITELK